MAWRGGVRPWKGSEGPSRVCVGGRGVARRRDAGRREAMRTEARAGQGGLWTLGARTWAFSKLADDEHLRIADVDAHGARRCGQP